MEFNLAINCDHDAFDMAGADVETARLLRKLADKLDPAEPSWQEDHGWRDGDPIHLLDANGNICGWASFTEDGE